MSNDTLSKEDILSKFINLANNNIGEGLLKTGENNAKLAIEIAEQLSRERATAFHRWAYENHYSKYWGSDQPNNNKWYKGFTPPDRTYLTDDELYNQYILTLKEK